MAASSRELVASFFHSELCKACFMERARDSRLHAWATSLQRTTGLLCYPSRSICWPFEYKRDGGKQVNDSCAFRLQVRSRSCVCEVLGLKFCKQSFTPKVFACGMVSAKCAGIFACTKRRHAGETSLQACAEVLHERCAKLCNLCFLV